MGCPYGPDNVWGITWPNAYNGTTNTQPCPGGVDTIGIVLLSCSPVLIFIDCTIGNATRICYENGTWGDANVLSCWSLAIDRVAQEVNNT